MGDVQLKIRTFYNICVVHTGLAECAPNVCFAALKIKSAIRRKMRRAWLNGLAVPVIAHNFCELIKVPATVSLYENAPCVVCEHSRCVLATNKHTDQSNCFHLATFCFDCLSYYFPLQMPFMFTYNFTILMMKCQKTLIMMCRHSVQSHVSIW